MDFSLTKEQEMLKKLSAQFAEEELEPVAAEIDAEHRFPEENFAKMAKVGFTGIGVPEQYGGSGGGMLEKVIAVSEFAKKCMASAATLSIHLIAPHTILDFGTEEQKQKFLRPLVDGSKIGCFGLTEPGAGTDASGVKTTAKLDGDHYVLNGQKVFTTNSGFADTFIIFAYTDKSAGTRGMSAFIVDRDSEGLTVSKDIPRMGIRAASNAEVALVDVKVPKENLIGREGMGYKIAMGALAGGRIGIGAQSVGIAQGALNEAIKYVKERKQFGKPIAKFQNTQFLIAALQTKIDAPRLMVWRAAKAKDDHENFAPLAAQCKLFASDVAVEVTRGAVQMLGGYGYSREYPVERMYRDAKITEIYEGTSEAMKMIVGGGLLR